MANTKSTDNGIDKLTRIGPKWSSDGHRYARRHPGYHRFGTQMTECAAAVQMALDVEGVVDGGMKVKKISGLNLAI